MRQLIVVRHAKSSWADHSLSDHSRPLNARGQQDAPRMAAWTYSRIGESPIRIFCSDATRTRQTAAFFVAQGEESSTITYHNELYHASAIAIESFVQESVTEEQNVMIITHNPGITEALQLVPNIQLDNLPTCGVGVLEVNVAWDNFLFSSCLCKALKFPKQL